MTEPFTLLILALCTVTSLPAENRSLSGTGNSPDDRGAANRPFIRLAEAAYRDGRSTLAGANRPNPRLVSNLLSKQRASQPNRRSGSDFIWQWGQFLDHDISRTPKGSGEDASIPVLDPTDPLYPVIPLERSAFVVDSDGVRQQKNAVTSFVDASQVYGPDPLTAHFLRSYSGGRLKTGPDGLLPFNDPTLPLQEIGRVPRTELRLAGDKRVNEHPGLVALHTLFVHEHNRLAGQVASSHPDWSDEQIYQRARKLVGAIVQSITYHEWLPTLLGPVAPNPSTFLYDSTVDPTVSNEFAGALFRFGHSLVSPKLMRIRDDHHLDDPPSVGLAEAFFFPPAIESPAAYRHYLKGLASHHHQKMDAQIVDPLRQSLFGPPGSGGMDLAALNIQRGRDHGLPDYNSVRAAYGLRRIGTWSQLSSDPLVQAGFAALYPDIDDLDLWPAALSEDLLPGAAVGELMAVSIAREFTRLAVGDAYFYRWDPAIDPDLRDEITSTTLRDVISRNTGLSLQPNLFFVPEAPFTFQSMGRRPEGGVEITFFGEPGYEYQIKHGSTPSRIVDDLLLEPLTTGNATHLLEAVDPGALHPGGRFYKIMRTQINPE